MAHPGGGPPGPPFAMDGEELGDGVSWGVDERAHVYPEEVLYSGHGGQEMQWCETLDGFYSPV